MVFLSLVRFYRVIKTYKNKLSLNNFCPQVNLFIGFVMILNVNKVVCLLGFLYDYVFG